MDKKSKHQKLYMNENNTKQSTQTRLANCCLPKDSNILFLIQHFKMTANLCQFKEAEQCGWRLILFLTHWRRQDFLLWLQLVKSFYKFYSWHFGLLRILGFGGMLLSRGGKNHSKEEHFCRGYTIPISSKQPNA